MAEPHSEFEITEVRTAKCHVCEQRNKIGVLRRCTDCSWSICTPCYDQRGGGEAATRHGMQRARRVRATTSQAVAAPQVPTTTVARPASGPSPASVGARPAATAEEEKTTTKSADAVSPAAAEASSSSAAQDSSTPSEEEDLPVQSRNKGRGKQRAVSPPSEEGDRRSREETPSPSTARAKAKGKGKQRATSPPSEEEEDPPTQPKNKGKGKYRAKSPTPDDDDLHDVTEDEQSALFTTPDRNARRATRRPVTYAEPSIASEDESLFTPQPTEPARPRTIYEVLQTASRLQPNQRIGPFATGTAPATPGTPPRPAPRQLGILGVPPPGGFLPNVPFASSRRLSPEQIHSAYARPHPDLIGRGDQPFPFLDSGNGAQFIEEDAIRQEALRRRMSRNYTDAATQTEPSAPIGSSTTADVRSSADLGDPPSPPLSAAAASATAATTTRGTALNDPPVSDTSLAVTRVTAPPAAEAQSGATETGAAAPTAPPATPSNKHQRSDEHVPSSPPELSSDTPRPPTVVPAKRHSSAGEYSEEEGPSRRRLGSV